MLFRPEALIHAQQDPAEGTVLLSSPRILWTCSLASLIAAIAIACLLATARHSPRLRLTAVVSDDLRARIVVPAAMLPRMRIGQRLALGSPAKADIGGRQDYATVRAVSPVVPGQYRVLLDIERAQHPGAQVHIDIPLPAIRLIDWIMHTLTTGQAPP